MYVIIMLIMQAGIQLDHSRENQEEILKPKWPMNNDITIVLIMSAGIQ